MNNRDSNAGAARVTRRQILKCGAWMATLAMTGKVWATEQYPNKPITIIVPYAAGGQGDVFARLIGDRLGRALGQPVIVDNRPGASGAVGARLASKASADGYFLLMGQTGEIAVNGSAMKEPGYDALKDFRAVALVGNAPLIMVAPASAPYNSIDELLALDRKNPGSISYASSGTATPGHLAGAMLAQGTKTNMVHIPYKGAGQAMTDVIGGQVHLFFSSASAAMPHLKAGKLKALAVSTPARLATLPQVPTVEEAGVKDFDFSLWGGFFAPRAAPTAIVDQLNLEINTILLDPEVRARFEADSSAVAPRNAADFDAFVRAEIDKYALLVKAAGAQVE